MSSEKLVAANDKEKEKSNVIVPVINKILKTKVFDLRKPIFFIFLASQA